MIPTQAKSVCFADAEGVRHHSPDMWVSWTYRMNGHKGERCYFPTTKDHKKWDKKYEQDTGAIIPAAASIPLPRSRLGTQDEIDARIDRIAATVARSVLDISLEEWVRSLF